MKTLQHPSQKLPISERKFKKLMISACTYAFGFGFGFGCFILPAQAATTATTIDSSLASKSKELKGEERASIAIVLQDQISLRATPRDSGQVHAQLSAGDMIEVRGERLDYLQVYDHRRERAGFVKTSQVKRLRLVAQDGPELLHAIRLVRDTPGSESLGLGFAAAYIRIASAQDMNSASGAEVLDALGSMADRLAARVASAPPASPTSKASELATMAHLDLARAYGLKFRGLEGDSRIRVCYDGEAFRQVLAMPANDEQKARAALALTRQECTDPTLQTASRYRLEQWRALVLEQVSSSALPDYLKNKIHLRRAAIWSGIAYQQARIEQAGATAILGSALKTGEIDASTIKASGELAKVNRAELTDEDLATYNDAAMRVSASRWASKPYAPVSLDAAKTGVLARQGLTIEAEEGEPGETCVVIKQAAKAQAAFRKCTYGLVWLASLSMNNQGNTLSFAVQPTETWREMWVLRKTADGWTSDVLPPSSLGAELGYVEFAGFTPDGKQVLVAREARVQNRYKRSFEVVSLDSMATDKQASDPTLLGAFQRWQSPSWKASTVSIR